MNPEPNYGPSNLINPVTLWMYRAGMMSNPTLEIMLRTDLVGLCEQGKVPKCELYQALGMGTVAALEQLAAQYGLLKPGTQGVA